METMPDNAIKFIDGGRICAFLIPTETTDHYFTGNVYGVTAWEDDGTPVCYHTDSGEFDAVAFFTLKWDGCFHLQMVDQDGDSVHICGADSMDRTLRMLRWMWQEARARIERYDPNIGGELAPAGV